MSDPFFEALYMNIFDGSLAITRGNQNILLIDLVFSTVAYFTSLFILLCVFDCGGYF